MLPFFLGEPQELPDPALPTQFAKHVAETEEPWLELAPTPQRDRRGNRLWDLTLWRGERPLRRWTTVTGRVRYLDYFDHLIWGYHVFSHRA